MLEVLTEDGIKNLDEFAKCADWELAGGYTTVGGKRVKDEGLLEKFDLSFEEARVLVMAARLQLGWITQDEYNKEISPEETVSPEIESE
jgi:N utilization substance protein A